VSGFVDLFSEPVTVPAVTTGPAEDIQDASVTLTGSIEPTTGLEASCQFRYGLRYGTNTSYDSTAKCVPAGPFSSLNAVTAEITGLQPETAYHYRLEGTTSNGTTPGAEETFTTLEKVVTPPTVSIKPVKPIAQRSATFNGKINPNEAETTYHFEYSTEAAGTNWTSLAEQSAGKGSSEVPVTETATGLTGHTTYYVRLVAENSGEHGVTGGGASTSSEETFATLAGPPNVSGIGVIDVNSGEATLHATIDPENQPATTYRFEYGPTAAYGTTVPVGEGHVVGSTPTQVSQAIAGLAPDTTYHFRVVASNGVGSPTTTIDQTFTTYSSAQASTGCPNEQVRKESDVNPETGVPFSLQLPECRAYEMVSPELKNGAPISSAGTTGLATGSTVARVGPEGSTVLIRSSSIWPGEQPANNNLLYTEAVEAVQYRITRGESGWSHRPEVPPNLLHFINELLPYPSDMSTNGIWVGGGLAPTEAQIELVSSPNIYFLEPDGALAKVGPSVPPSDQDQTVVGGADSSSGDPARGEVGIVGGSANLSRVLFNVPTYRWPFDETRLGSTAASTDVSSLYEYIGAGHSGEGSDLPTLVGVDNTGALISQCGTEAAGYENSEAYVAPRLPGSVEAEARSISAGGSTVFFVARGVGSPECNGGAAPAENQVFARVGEPGAGTAVGKAVTVNVAGTTGCATSDSCNVTKAVTYQGASTDGSKVFFTSEQPLLAHDTDSTSNLYECGGLPGDSGAPLIGMTPVNACPDLARVSVPVSGAGAEVQSVVSVSADGSHVYFVAKGVLSGENAEHNSPAQGQDNLYVWQEPSPGYPQGGTAFVATLSAALGFGEAQMTPDGEQLVFESSADLTLDDTSTVSQVFLYEARREALIRVSKGQDGFNNDGDTTSDPAYISTAETGGGPNVLEGRRTISEDGSVVVFQSDDALTPQVHGGTRNVYLWRGGNVYLISDGTPAGNQAKGAVQAGLVGVDASGQNVFFTTEAQLVGQDKDELSDLYDARVDGGFPAPKVNECVGEACQGAPSAPPGPVMPGSLSPSGQGNLAPLPAVKSTTPPPKPLTRAQKLAKALKACTKDNSTFGL
jgi:hypothetical protein